MKKEERIRINEDIRAKELRVIGSDGGNVGVLPTKEALAKAKEANLDLIEIAPNTKPPVAKIMDYGKFQYEQKKKESAQRASSKTTETKSVQVKMGTGEHDKALKAKRAAQWLEEGHRVKVELFLKGRYKYMEPAFLKGKLEEFLTVIPYPYKIADPMRKNPKGFVTTIERDAAKKPKADNPAPEEKKNHENE